MDIFGWEKKREKGRKWRKLERGCVFSWLVQVKSRRKEKGGIGGFSTQARITFLLKRGRQMEEKLNERLKAYDMTNLPLIINFLSL